MNTNLYLSVSYFDIITAFLRSLVASILNVNCSNETNVFDHLLDNLAWKQRVCIYQNISTPTQKEFRIIESIVQLFVLYTLRHLVLQ